MLQANESGYIISSIISYLSASYNFIYLQISADIIKNDGGILLAHLLAHLLALKQHYFHFKHLIIRNLFWFILLVHFER